MDVNRDTPIRLIVTGFLQVICYFLSSRTNTSCAVFIEVISSATVNRVPLADVGANVVDADLPSVTWFGLTDTFIDVLKQK